MKTFTFSHWELLVRRRDRIAPASERPTFADRLRVARIARGWSQEALAREIGYSVRTVRRWEEGAQPRPRGLFALSEALDLDLGEAA